jgi:hypothetical protein
LTPVDQGRLRRLRDAGAPYKFDLAIDARKHFDLRRADIHSRPLSGWIRISLVSFLVWTSLSTGMATANYNASPATSSTICWYWSARSVTRPEAIAC